MSDLMVTAAQIVDQKRMLPDAIRDERSETLAALIARLAALPVERAHVMDVDNVDASALPALAEHFDVLPLVRYCSSIPARRALIRDALTLQQQRGTLRGMRWLARLSGSTLVRAQTPPGKIFASTGMSDAERAQFEAQHPEVLVFPFRKNGWRTGLMVGDILNRSYTTRNDACHRIGDRVELHDPQSSAPVTLSYLPVARHSVDGIARDAVPVCLFGNARGLFAGRGLSGKTVDHSAALRIYTIDLTRPSQDAMEREAMLSITPSLVPMRSTFEPVSLSGKAVGAFAGRRAIPLAFTHSLSSPTCAPVKSDANHRIAKRLRLFDARRMCVTARRRASLYAGAARMPRVPPHTAKLTVDLHRTMSAHKASVANFLARRFMVASTAQAGIDRARDALLWAKRASDTVLLSTTPYQPITVSPAARVGSARVGQYILEVI